MIDLRGNTTYYIRAYATNELGIGYGEILSFKTLSAVPELTTIEISNLTQHTCLTGGKITYDGGYPIKLYGVCWSTSPNPKFGDNMSVDGPITDGLFTSTLGSFSLNTTYYVRAYAMNDKEETGYGNEITITTVANPILFNSEKTYGTVTDIDGNTYRTIELGSQVWMAENLRTQKFSNGDLIGTINSSIPNITKETSPKYQWVFENNEHNLPVYGRLYTWYVATDNRNVCPVGWHVPTLDEWFTLSLFSVADGKMEGGRLKEKGLTHWNKPNLEATNETGFTAVPSGWRLPWGEGAITFNYLGEFADYWMNRESSTTNGTCVKLDCEMNVSSYFGLHKAFGLSIRCLKD